MIMEKVFLSVILSTYNDELYIWDAINSILDQTYPYFELIIINDGSTDNTENIIKEFNDERIVYVKKENTGLADSLNYGISLAKYPWIVRMDGDDISFPQRFEMQVQAITPDVDIIGTNAIRIDEQGKERGVMMMRNKKESIITGLKAAKPAFIHPTVMIRKSLLEQVGGYDVNFSRGQDYDLWLRCLLLCNNVINIQSPLLYYRVFINKRMGKSNIINMFIALWGYYNKNEKTLSKEEYELLRCEIEKKMIFKVLYFSSRKVYSNRYFFIKKMYNIQAAFLLRLIKFYKYPLF